MIIIAEFVTQPTYFHPSVFSVRVQNRQPSHGTCYQQGYLQPGTMKAEVISMAVKTKLLAALFVPSDPHG